MGTVTKLRDFLLTYPGLEPGSEIVVMPFSPNFTQGNGLSYSGLGETSIRNDVMGDAWAVYRESYTLDILRHLTDEIDNEEITEFIRDFEKWIVRQSIFRRAPRFGTDGDYDERVTARGGYLAVVESKEASIPFAAYRTTITIQYQEHYDMYESEGD